MSFGSGGSVAAREVALWHHEFKGTADTQPTHIYVGLSTTDPLQDGSGITEPSTGGYARVICDSWTVSGSITNQNSVADAAGVNAQNTSEIDFGTPSADWGTIAYAFTADASTSGNIRQVCKLDVAQLCNAGNPVSIAAGALKFQKGWLTPHS